MFRTSRDKERGATLVEAAVIMPLLLLVVISIMEYGLAFKDYLTVSYLSREGARIGALAGDDLTADCAVLTGLGELISPSDLARLDYIEIYEADQNTGAQGATNRAVFNVGNDPTVCNVPATALDGWTISPVGWPPSSRNTAVGTNPLDIVGVRVVLTRSWITGFGPFSGTATVDEFTITRLEPEVFE
ncbi:MAG TPA: TadE/TadG family type IV pilus assembly protein [Acidimicrobiia bacterium]|nr:TadE/TadG family type IV pilus assembly protein [Acidimicrobiia bacterium]